jgi:uncharacterized repeat protein (TIGR02543 family)
MKKYLLLILALILSLSLVFALSSCEIVIGGSSTDDTNDPDQDPDDKNDEDDTPNDEVDEEYTVTFKYFYGNKVYENTTIDTVKVDAEVGFTDEQIAKIDTYSYHGYGFEGWYTDKNFLSKFNFKTPVTADLTLYAKYDVTTAGKNITWHLSSDVTELTFKGTGPMYDYLYDTDVPWKTFIPKIKTIVFEEGITNIGAHTAAGATGITELYIPASVKSIGKNAFMQCTSLTKITHANSGYKINGVSTTVSFPDTLEIIGEGAFKQCTGISRMIIFGDGLVSIGDNAFYMCDDPLNKSDDITDIVIPKSLRNIGATAFYGAENLKRVFFKGTKDDYNISYGVDNYYVRDISVTYYLSESKPQTAGAYWYYVNGAGETPEIRQYYFALRYKTPTGVDAGKYTYEFIDWVEITDVANNKGYCTKLNQQFRDRIEKDGYKYKSINEAIVTSNSDITKNTAIVEDKEFILYRGNIMADGHGVVLAYNGTAVTVGLHKNFNPKTMSSEIWDYANVEASKYFWESSGGARMLHEEATVLNINSGITYIGKYAFARMTQLKTLVIPASVKTIHKDAFHGSSELLNIYYEGDDLKIVDDYGNEVATLDGCVKAQIYSKTTMSTVSEGGWWMKLPSNKIIAWYYEYETDTLYVGGDTTMENFASYEDTPWYGVEAKKLVIRPETVSISENLVSGMSTVETITIPASVRIIPASAFAGTKAINQAKASEDGCFYIDGHLIKVVDPTKLGADFQMRVGVYSIAENAFANCPNLRSVYVSSTVIGIHKNAFNGADGLEKIYFAGLPAVWNNVVDRDFALPSGVEIYYLSATKPTVSGWENYNWFKMSGGKIEIVDYTKQ